MVSRRIIAVFVVLALGLGPLAPVARAAGVVRAPVNARPAWAAQTAQLAALATARPGLLGADNAGVLRMLSHARVELNLRPDAALAFVPYLPPQLRADPAAFAALPAERRLELAAEAVRQASEQLTARAEQAVRSRQHGDSAARARAASELPGLADRWFYLNSALAESVKEERKSLPVERALRGPRALLARLMPKTPDLYAGQNVVDAELRLFFDGVESLARQRDAVDIIGPQRPFVASTLAPYAKDALQRAQSRLDERAIPADRIEREFLESRDRTFEYVAPRGLSLLLRPGEWDELMSGLVWRAVESLDADSGVTAPGAYTSEQKAYMFNAISSDPGLYGKDIPSWATDAGRRGNIPVKLTTAHGLTRDPGTGTPAFRTFGISWGLRPFTYLDAAMIPFLLYGAYTLATGWNVAFPLALLTVPTVVVLSAVTHEFGHALVARAHRLDAAIRLSLWLSTTQRHLRLSPAKELAYALGGPLANLTVATLALGVMAFSVAPALTPFFYVLAANNLFMMAYNLLPLPGLDGLKILLHAREARGRRSVDR